MTGPGQPRLVPLQRGAGDCAEPPSPAPSCRAVSTRGGELPRPAPSRPPCLGCWGLIARLPKFSFLPHQVPPQPVGGCSSHRMRQERVLSGPACRARRGGGKGTRGAPQAVHGPHGCTRAAVRAGHTPAPASLQVRSPGLRFRLLHWAVWRGGKSVATGSGGWPGPRSVPNELAPWALVSPSAQEPLPALGPGAQGAHTPSCGGSRDVGRPSAGQVGGGALRVGLRCRLPEGPVLLTSESPPQSLPPGCRLHVPGA